MRHIFSGSVGCSVCLVLSLFADGASAAKESVLYRFAGGSDGAAPMASMLADSAGNLYGTTSQGGGSTNCTAGCGTVFELSPPKQRDGAWTETVLYSFQGGNDGATPAAPLVVDNSGNLYGVTSAGGGNCNNQDISTCGTVFELMRPQNSGSTWTEALLYSFKGNPNGRGDGDVAWPNGLVFDKSGNLDGLAYSGGHCTTDQTGTYCNGGAFSLTPQNGAWTESVIYRFRGETGDPASPLLDGNGRLYGRVSGGSEYDCGEIFRLTASNGHEEWREESLYDFQCGNDGAFPVPGLAFDTAGNLYGMSLGAFGNPGNVFELSPTKSGEWSESVLYDFSEIADGYTPSVGPIFGAKGRLYGTTEEGGQTDDGVVFQLTPKKRGRTWTERVLHSFALGSGGFAPYGGLTLGKDNAIYGTTSAGGTGYGTVFEVVP